MINQQRRMFGNCLAIVLAGWGIAHGQQPAPTRQVIMDPVFQMEAFTLKVPAGWTFDGTLLPPSSCDPAGIAVYRATSLDGITQVKLLPRISWAWSESPAAGVQKFGAPKMSASKNTDCLAWDKKVPAAEFLRYMVGMLQVEFVKDEPVTDMAQFQEMIRKQNQSFAAQTPSGMPPYTLQGDRARALVRYKVDSAPVEESLQVTLTCTDSSLPAIPSGWRRLHSCGGTVLRLRARQGNLEASRGLLSSIQESVSLNQQWLQTWIADRKAQGQRALQMGAEAQARLQRQHAQAMEAQAVQTRQQQEMQAVTRRGTDMALQQDRERVGAQSRIADDWADYALDLQKRQDPRTGEITKDSSQYSYTWIDEFGQRYQTNDVNDNPNGRLKGNWTLQQNVR